MWVKIKAFGENALLIEWTQSIDKQILREISILQNQIQKSETKGIIDIIPAFASLTIVFDNTLCSYDALKLTIENILIVDTDEVIKSGKLWKIPVEYHFENHKDMQFLLHQHQMRRTELIEIHTKPIYEVYFIGFLPGFLYLGGLDNRLHTPRKKTPDLRIPKGSVAIGGMQTGIYPQESPGGWHVIGQTNFTFFDYNVAPYCQIKSGDQIQFEAI